MLKLSADREPSLKLERMAHRHEGLSETLVMMGPIPPKLIVFFVWGKRSLVYSFCALHACVFKFNI